MCKVFLYDQKGKMFSKQYNTLNQGRLDAFQMLWIEKELEQLITDFHNSEQRTKDFMYKLNDFVFALLILLVCTCVWVQH